jgi:N-hydroxyarylamine O-acetyltransferase
VGCASNGATGSSPTDADNVEEALDLDAYLARIGLSGRPSLIDVHRAHATSIPFENLDPRRGRPVSPTALPRS